VRDHYAYYAHRGAKTLVLDLLRSLFRWGPLERWLASRTMNTDPASAVGRLVPREYLYPKGSRRVVERGGFQWRLDLSDAVDHFIYFGFAETGFDRLLERIKPASRIIDVGANIGMLTLPFARKAGGGRVVSFEPDPVNRERLVGHLALNGIGNVRVEAVGLGGEERMHRLCQVVGTNSGMNRIILEDPASERFPFTEINIARLDHIWPHLGLDRVDLIKIDVEGFEMEVLKGAGQVLGEFRPDLFIELDDRNLRENGSSAEGLVDLLHAHGYSIEQGNTGAPLPADLTCCHLDLLCHAADPPGTRP